MRKISGFINTLSLTLFLSLVGALPTYAQNDFLCPKDDSGFSKLCQLKGDNAGFAQLLGTGISIAFIAAVIIALFFLIWGGIKWILSGGDKGGVEAARNTIVAAVIGLIVTFAAYFILSLVLQFFGLSLSNIKLPQFVR